MSPRLLQWENWESEGLFYFIFFFQCYVCPEDKSASHTNEDCWKTLMGTETCTRQLVLDQHNKSQSHHGLLKLHLVSKLDIRKRKTKSLSGWKLKCRRSSEKLNIRRETLTKALQIITHMVCFRTFSQRKIQRFETKLLPLLSQFPYI